MQAVHVQAPAGLSGRMAPVRVDEAHPNSLSGTVVGAPGEADDAVAPTASSAGGGCGALGGGACVKPVQPPEAESTTLVQFDDNSLLPLLFGQHDQNLARIEQQLGVSLVSRGNRLAISGSARGDAGRQAGPWTPFTSG